MEGEDQHEVCTEAHERLLPHRHQARVTGQQVPHARHRENDELLHQDAGGAGVDDVREVRQHDDDDQRAYPGPRDVSARTGDPESLHRKRGGLRGEAHDCAPREIRPCGRSASTARNTMNPARVSSEMLIWAPICWATPSTTPPSRVPHKEPSPPITTAANANSRIVSVPVVGWS